ncbi:MAG: ATP-binding protein [Desulfobacula sp.]|uniref:sensor histidine kinase n=1 Tax=Desulfobacula sp. TaxID=2593537 RepID=UPI0025C002C2|nr:ATP-binding protein [Desulfobacula sp.]MCD4722002.1 ATP-binding protein [Desulfobacula sp.]
MKIIKRLQKLKPAFWDHRDIAGTHSHTGFNFTRKWKLIVLFTSFMALLPLFVMTLVDSRLTHRTIEDEMKSSMSKILNSAAASISLSKDLKKSALKYVALLDSGEDNDIFVVNETGTLLTPSFHYGKAGTPNALNTKQFKDKAGIEEDIALDGKAIIAGYARIPDSSLIVVLVKNKKWLTDLWFKPRLKLVGYLAVSIVLILLSIMGSTYLVGRIHSADRKRIKALHHAEYANKLASIGRLASGVAHEINNPLAIINQKTGLIMDLFTLKKDLSSDERLMPLAKDVLDAVKRCGTITRRLLDFARHMEPSIQPVNIGMIIGQVLAFLEKEAERRCITISVENEDFIPNFECDRGSLQQVFLNLIENAFAAMEDGGRLNICVRFKKKQKVTISVSDNGKGISDDDIHKIFEPFYSSKNDHWGSGLGLSITYGLVKEIGGDIIVKSTVGEGTCFTLTLPLNAEAKNGKR